MKRYAFNVPALKSIFTFTLPDLSFKENRKLGVFANLLKWLFYITVPAMFLVLPFYKISASAWDQSVFSFLILFLGFLLFIFIAKVILFGNRELSDPKFFMSVILFTLFSTTASVFALPANVANTFGAKDFRLLSGLSVFVFLLLFYFIRKFLLDTIRLRTLLRSLFVGFIAYLFVLAFVTGKVTLQNELPALIIASSFFFILLLNSGKNKLVKTLILLGLLLITIVQFLNFRIFASVLGDTLVPLMFTTLALDILLYVSNKKLVLNFVKDYKKSINEIAKNKKVKNLRIFLRNTFISVIFATPIIALVILIGMLISGSYSFTRIAFDFNSIISSFKYLFAESSTNFLTLFMGAGFRGAVSDGSLFANLIRIQGLIGVVTYTIFGSFAIYNFYKAMKANLYNNKVLISIGFVLLALPIFSLFVYPTLFVAVLWWICFAILSFIVAPKSVKEALDQRIFPLVILGRFNNIYGLLIKLVLISTTGVILYLIVSSFLKVIG